MPELPTILAVETVEDSESIAELARFLMPRIEQARCGEISLKSIADIRREARKEIGL